MKKILLGLLIVKNLMSLEVNQIPNNVLLDNENGGMLNGSTWDSSVLQGKVNVFLYVDPDEKDLNSDFADTLQNQSFDKEKYQYTAIINLAATWKPNFIIETKLKQKQEQYPNSIYVKDNNKILVKEWGLSDDNSNVLVFNKQGKLIYKKSGKLSKQDRESVIKLITENL